MLKPTSEFVVYLFVVIGVACGPKPHPGPTPTVFLERFDTIADGASNAYKVPAGTYRLQMTATSDGASVSWVGGSCKGSKKTTIFDADCSLQQDGQLEIGNPSHLNFGASISVTLKLTRL